MPLREKGRSRPPYLVTKLQLGNQIESYLENTTLVKFAKKGIQISACGIDLFYIVLAPVSGMK